jgi:SH3-like domain-containing protein
MKNLRLNITILTITIAFLVFGLIGEKTGAQTKSSAKATPTPKKPTNKATPKPPAKSPATAKATPKNTSKPTPKTTAKATPKPTPKTTQPKTKELPQVIVSVTSARVRKEADTNAETLELAKLGTIFQIVEQTDKWSKVKFSRDGKEQNGWVSKTVSLPFTNAKRAEIYQTVADKYLKQSALDFTTAAQVFDFLNSSTKEIKTQKTLADLSLKRLIALQNALQKVAIDKQTQSPYKEFLKANEKEIAYSEPSAQWLVRSGNFWELHAKYKTLPIGEEIAWSAAQNPIPGECEGYINCYLYLIRSTDGEYLNFYPNGKYSRQSLKNITNLLEPIAADADEKTIYSSASDTSDRADFNRYLTELRAIIAKTSYIEKSKPLAQIRQIAEAHR